MSFEKGGTSTAFQDVRDKSPTHGSRLLGNHVSLFSRISFLKDIFSSPPGGPALHCRHSLRNTASRTLPPIRLAQSFPPLSMDSGTLKPGPNPEARGPELCSKLDSAKQGYRYPASASAPCPSATLTNGWLRLTRRGP